MRAQVRVPRRALPAQDVTARSPAREPLALLAPHWLLTCEVFLCGFKAARPGSSRRRLGAHASAPATAAPGRRSAGAKMANVRAAVEVQQSPGASRRVSMLALPKCPGRAEPVKAVRDRRSTAPVELPGRRPREDGLTEPARQSRSRQLSAAWAPTARTVDFNLSVRGRTRPGNSLARVRDRPRGGRHPRPDRGGRIRV